MRTIVVPFHIDELIEDLDVPFIADVTVIPQLPRTGHWQDMAALYEVVAVEVATAASSGDVPVVISGDCTTSLGTVAGLQRAGIEPGIVWLDAHGDVQTLETTASGYVGGMPLRLLVGYRPELVAASVGLQPVDESNVVLVDGRDLDPPEVTYLEQARIRRCEVADLPSIALPDRPLYVHVDADVLDPGDLSGLRFPAAGGPRVVDVAAGLQRVLADADVAAIGVGCTWRPGEGASAQFQTIADVLADGD